ncbi:MAG: hypothetical protein IJK87_12415 [Prevotella sp.]|nr:hypothetical protein [Prevotella sp.]
MAKTQTTENQAYSTTTSLPMRQFNIFWAASMGKKGRIRRRRMRQLSAINAAQKMLKGYFRPKRLPF